jgi:hypothetical protein
VCVWGTGGKHGGGSETEKHRHENVVHFPARKEQSNERKQIFKKIQMKCNEMNLRGADEDKQQQQQAQKSNKAIRVFLVV